jgi:hypothetical protein
VLEDIHTEFEEVINKALSGDAESKSGGSSPVASSMASTTFSDLEAIYGPAKAKAYTAITPTETKTKIADAFDTMLAELQNNDKVKLVSKKDAENILKDFDDIAEPKGDGAKPLKLQRRKIITLARLISVLGGEDAVNNSIYDQIYRAGKIGDLKTINEKITELEKKAFQTSL